MYDILAAERPGGHSIHPFSKNPYAFLYNHSSKTGLQKRLNKPFQRLKGMSNPMPIRLVSASMNPHRVVNQLLDENPALLKRKRKDIYFEVDYDGKRLLNTEVSKLYDKRFIISYAALAEIVTTSVAVIDKMIVLKTCGWRLEELHGQLEAGIVYWNNHASFGMPELLQSKPKGLVAPKAFIQDDLSEKFPATMKTQDGHYVRSKSEIIIDNFLFNNGIVHAYEKKLPGNAIAYADFWIPGNHHHPHSVYIEYGSLLHNPACLERKASKLAIYKKYQLHLIQLTDTDVYNIDVVLPEKLRKFGIYVQHA